MISFEERLYDIFKIISCHNSISKPELAKEVQRLISEKSEFILTGLNRLDEVLEVDIRLGRLKEDEQGNLSLTSEGKQWMEEHRLKNKEKSGTNGNK